MKYIKKPSRQHIVGDGGVIGFRVVRESGIIKWLGRMIQDDRLIPYIGQDVHIWDDAAGELYIHEGGFDAKNRPIQGKWIVTLNIN